jgi:hypothetical protein
MRIQYELLSFSGISINIIFLLPTVIEIDNALRFASQRENYYKKTSSDMKKGYLQMKLIYT